MVMVQNIVLLAAALALSLPAFADKPSKSTQTIAKPHASKSASTGASKTLENGATANSGVIGDVYMMTVKNAKANNSDQRKAAQAHRAARAAATRSQEI